MADVGVVEGAAGAERIHWIKCWLEGHKRVNDEQGYDTATVAFHCAVDMGLALVADREALLERIRELEAERTEALNLARDSWRAAQKQAAAEWHSVAVDQLPVALKRVGVLEGALRDARPYVYNALCAARADGQTWRVETAEPILERVDAVLAGGEAGKEKP